MPDSPPSFERVLDQAVHGLANDDVRIFYEYFEQLRGQVGRRLAKKAKAGVGESAVLHSALFSMFQDVGPLAVPLGDRDADGRPMLWPLLLGYIERHCDKWNKYYRAKKRRGAEAAIGAGGSEGGFEPADPRGEVVDEDRVLAVCERLLERLTPTEQGAFDLWVEGRTLAESAAVLACSEAKVSYMRKRVRDLLLSE